MIPLAFQRYDLVTPERSLPSSPSLCPAQITHEVANRHSTSHAVDVSELARLLQKASLSGPRPRPRSQLVMTSKPPSPSSSTSSSPTLSPLPPPVLDTNNNNNSSSSSSSSSGNVSKKLQLQMPPPPPRLTVSTANIKQRPPLQHRPATCSTPTQFIFKKPEYDQHYHDTHFHHQHPPPQTTTSQQQKRRSTTSTATTTNTNSTGASLDRTDLSRTWTDLRRFFVPDTVDSNNGKDSITFANQFRKNIGTRYGTWGRYIGKGAGGSVRLIRRASDQKTFAVKQFRKRMQHESEKDYVKKVTAEFCIGSALHHPNVIETLDIIQEDAQFYEIMEYAPNDLFNVVMSGMMSREEIACCWRQLLQGLSYIHGMGIAHRDLKLDNLMLDPFGMLKIIDFGCATVFRSPFASLDDTNKKPSSVTYSKGVFGSDPYIAPEQYTQASYDPCLADIWSCAIIYICMTIRRFPWRLPRSSDPSFLAFSTQPQQPFRLLKLLPREARPVIASMLEIHPKRRSNLQQMLSDPWVRSIDMCHAEEPGSNHVHHVLVMPPPPPPPTTTNTTTTTTTTISPTTTGTIASAVSSLPPSTNNTAAATATTTKPTRPPLAASTSSSSSLSIDVFNPPPSELQRQKNQNHHHHQQPHHLVIVTSEPPGVVAEKEKRKRASLPPSPRSARPPQPPPPPSSPHQLPFSSSGSTTAAVSSPKPIKPSSSYFPDAVVK